MTSRTGFSRWLGAACGLLAAAVAMGIAQLLAGLTVPAASPVVAVGEAAIDHTPLAVKDWAISTFGSGDKTALLTGVFVIVFLYSLVVGVLAIRWLALGYAGLVLFAVIGLAAALTRHGATPSYVVPTLFGAVAGGLALTWLVLTARRATGAGRAETSRAETSRAGDAGWAENDSDWTNDAAWAALDQDGELKEPEDRAEAGGRAGAGEGAERGRAVEPEEPREPYTPEVPDRLSRSGTSGV